MKMLLMGFESFLIILLSFNACGLHPSIGCTCEDVAHVF